MWWGWECLRQLPPEGKTFTAIEIRAGSSMSYVEVEEGDLCLFDWHLERHYRTHVLGRKLGKREGYSSRHHKPGVVLAINVLQERLKGPHPILLFSGHLAHGLGFSPTSIFIAFSLSVFGSPYIKLHAFSLLLFIPNRLIPFLVESYGFMVEMCPII